MKLTSCYLNVLGDMFYLLDKRWSNCAALVPSNFSDHWVRGRVESHHNFSLPFATPANASPFLLPVRYRRLSKVNLRFIVCFSVVMGSIVEPFTSDEGSVGRVNPPNDIDGGLHRHSQTGPGKMYDFVIIWVHFNTILASLSFLILFNIRRSPLPFSPWSFSPRTKCIAAMNFIYSLGSFSPFPSCIENLWCENILKYEPFFSLFSVDIYFRAFSTFLFFLPPRRLF